MSDRDPRTAPQKGDTVTVAGETREVDMVRDGRVYYSWPGRIAVRSLYPTGWAAWAADATAWTVASAEEVACDEA